MTRGSRIAVIGVGNEFRRDDGVGWAVIARLRKRAGGPPLPADTVLAHDEQGPRRDRPSRRPHRNAPHPHRRGRPSPSGNLDDLRACLYGLYGVLRLHFDQEEENYFSLAP